MTLILADMTSNILMLAGVLLLTILVMSNTRRKFASRLARGLTSREKIEQARQLSGTHNDLCEVMSRLEEVSRHFAAQLDAKAIQLQVLMEEAEVMIQRLRQAQGLAPESTPNAGPAPRASRQAGDNPASSANSDNPANPANSQIQRVSPDASAADFKSAQAALATGGVGNAGSSGVSSVNGVSGADPAMQHLNRQVYQLADAGLTTADIAKNLQQHVGKVELILALRQA